jgi:hypothetical protein
MSAALLDDVRAFLRRFVVYPSEAALTAHTLWVAHTHGMDLWESTPRIGFLSPEPGSGKSRALEVTELLVPNPVRAVNATPAYLFRRIASEAGLPTILYDEIDTLFGPKARPDCDDVRAVLNAGHRKGAVAGRCRMNGRTVVPEELPAYCAVALAGLHDLPDTLASRTIIVRMRKRAPSEPVESFRRRVVADEGHALMDRLAIWVPTVPAGIWPNLPAEVTDRDADVWEPLLMVADWGGGEWPALARDAAVTLVTESKRKPPSLGVTLLRDLRDLFNECRVDELFTWEILEALLTNEDLPWGDLSGRPLDARGLARLLRPYGIETCKNVRRGKTTGKGYRWAELRDAGDRYLGPASQEHVTSVTPEAIAAAEAC